MPDARSAYAVHRLLSGSHRFAKLTLDRAHLLAQEVFALTLPTPPAPGSDLAAQAPGLPVPCKSVFRYSDVCERGDLFQHNCFETMERFGRFDAI